jgi:hypothetical protein
MSAYVDEHGKLVVRDDIYGFDKRTTAILKGDDRVAANYAARPPKRTVIDAEKRRELNRLVDNPQAASEPASSQSLFPFFGRPSPQAANEQRQPEDFFDRLFR